MRTTTFKVGNVQVTITETDSKQLLFDLVALTPQTNIRGIFFDVANQDPFGVPLLIDGSADITSKQIKLDGVTSLPQGINMSGTGTGPFDVGIAFGTPQHPVHSTGFRLYKDAPLTLDDLTHVNFGVVATGGGPTKAVVSVPAAPDAVNDTLSVNEDVNPGNLTVLSNDTDADGTLALLITAVGSAAHGTAVIAADHKSINYTPSHNYSGTDSFSYTISDGHGGQDTANVAVNVVPVADTPTINVQVEAGDAVNEIKLHITTAVTDTDGSEYIDRVVFTGLPGNAQITGAPGGVFDPSSSPQSLDQTFTLVLPQGANSDFNLGVTSYSHETANGNEASNAAGPVTVSYETSTQTLNETFLADDQNIWGTGNAFTFTFDKFLGVDLTGPNALNFNLGFPTDDPNTPQIEWADPLFYANLSASLKAGLQADIFLTGGQIDAQVPTDVTFVLDYNHTTDVLAIDPSFLITAEAAFQTLGPQGHAIIDAILQYNAEATVGLDLPDIPILGNPPPVDILHPVLSGDYSQNLINLDSADLTVSHDFGLGITGTLTWPNIDGTSDTPSGSTISSSAESDNFLQLDLNVGQALADIFLDGVNPLEIQDFNFNLPILGEGTIDATLAELHALAGLNALQDLELAMSGMTGTITFEDGASQQFTFGAATMITNASQHDSIAAGGNGDGQVQFSVALTPIATLDNTTNLGVNLGYSLDIAQATVTPADDNGLLNAGLDVAGFLTGQDLNPLNVGPLLHLDGEAQVATIPVFDNTFAFNFQPQTVDLVA